MKASWFLDKTKIILRFRDKAMGEICERKRHGTWGFNLEIIGNLKLLRVSYNLIRY